ncbi:hypothetical protein C8Q79DRAFT_1014857 [Trametes meyenii]|nr:hypothetical protein C8Q79DRAFT_1014857 [Trametes meyenii]
MDSEQGSVTLAVAVGTGSYYEDLPVEMWDAILSHLSRADLVSMARTCKYLGTVAEHRFYRDVPWLSHATFLGWTCAVMRPWRANAVRSLAVSFEGLSFSSTAAVSGELFRLRGALSSLPGLEELMVSGLSDVEASTQDIFGGCLFSLRKFFCDGDAVVLASWPSLRTHITLEEFGGFFDILHLPPVDVRPDAFPHLRVLDTGAPFARRIGMGSRITHLSVHVARTTACCVLKQIAKTLGHQLVVLRVVRTIQAPHSTGRADLEQAPFWESDSPIVLCRALRAPVLRYMEVRDKAPPGTKWTVDFDTLRVIPAFWYDCSKQATERTPLLSTLAWRPVWACQARLLAPIVHDHMQDFFYLLPSLKFAVLPLVASAQNAAFGQAEDSESWTLWEKVRVEEGTSRQPVDWWPQQDITFEQIDCPAPLGNTWATLVIDTSAGRVRDGPP